MQTPPSAAPPALPTSVGWSWRAGRWLMILAALIYGPLPSIIDIFDPHHLSNPEWNGHARLHLMWLIAICAYTGGTAAYLAWRSRPDRFGDMRIAGLMGAIIIGAFFTAGLLKDFAGANYGPPSHYFFDGQVGGPLIHFTIAGLLLVVGYALSRRGYRAYQEATHSE